MLPATLANVARAPGCAWSLTCQSFVFGLPNLVRIFDYVFPFEWFDWGLR